MHEGLDQELKAYEKRTPRSKDAHKRAESRLPLGVASNYRAYDPYPLFVRDGKGGHIHDIDGNEYLDFNLCFGALMAGHCHPAVIKAVQGKLATGTMFGMPHDLEWELAEEICKRFPVEMVRFSNSGTECTDARRPPRSRRHGPGPHHQNGRRLSRPARFRVGIA